MGGLVEGRSREFVAASADFAMNIGLARLVTGWRETKMGPDVARPPKSIRLICPR
jgi:hypothetical protein